VVCILFFENCFVVCFEKCVSGGTTPENSYGNYCLDSFFFPNLFSTATGLKSSKENPNRQILLIEIGQFLLI
jgi:hypothetical protein